MNFWNIIYNGTTREFLYNHLQPGTTYKLRVTTEEKDFITPNLKGQGGTGGSGNISSELGTIDNYKEIEGEIIPTYNMDLPPLPMFMGGTRYAFERPVVLKVHWVTKSWTRQSN